MCDVCLDGNPVSEGFVYGDICRCVCNKSRRRACVCVNISALACELCLDVHSADGTLPTGGQPLIHTSLME